MFVCPDWKSDLWEATVCFDKSLCYFRVAGKCGTGTALPLKGACLLRYPCCLTQLLMTVFDVKWLRVIHSSRQTLRARSRTEKRRRGEKKCSQTDRWLKQQFRFQRRFPTDCLGQRRHKRSTSLCFVSSLPVLPKNREKRENWLKRASLSFKR